MDYILRGDSKEVAKVLQENRIRVERGVIEFTPVQPDAALDADCIGTIKESHAAIAADCQRMTVAQHELAEIIREILASAMAHGGVLSDELAGRLDKFGIIVPKIAESVPKIAESVPESAETPENEGENVPETVPSAPEPMEDNKNVEVEDMTEVNLDDVKDIPEEDSKPEPASTPKKSRSKKSE